MPVPIMIEKSALSVSVLGLFFFLSREFVLPEDEQYKNRI